MEIGAHKIARDDRGLLNLIKQGNMLAFRQFYDRYAIPLLKATNRILPQEESEELIQDVFMRIWERPEEFDEVQSFKPYLSKMCYHLALKKLDKILTDIKRKEKVAMHMDTKDDSLNHHFEQQDLERFLDNTVKMLPPKQAQVYRLSIEEHLDYKQIAARLGKSPDTIRVQLVAARKFVRECVSKNYNYSHQASVVLLCCGLFT